MSAPFVLPTLAQIRSGTQFTCFTSTKNTNTDTLSDYDKIAKLVPGNSGAAALAGGGSKLTGAKLLAAKGLDIETLKLEVERRGGYDEVEKRREWRQIARAMNVPPNTCAEHLRRQYVAGMRAYTSSLRSHALAA